MRARIVILIALGAGLALFLAFRPPPTEVAPAAPVDDTDDNALMLWHYPLDCPTTNIEPEFELEVSLDPADGKNRLTFTIGEVHDFYVQSLKLEFWYKPEPDTTCETSPYCVEVPLDNYIKAGEFYEGCLDLNDAEVGLFGGSMGTVDNWDGHVLDSSMTKWCTKNPEVLRREGLEDCLSSSG